MPARRNKGSGSITWDETAQRWTARLDLGVGPNGRRVRVKATAPTKAEARRKLDRLQNEHQSGMDLTQRDVTVAELTELWLQRGLANTVTANTRANYTALLRTHVLPGIGARKVATLEPEHIEALLDHLAGKGYATRTLGLTLSLIRRVLTFGQRRRLVVRNVADLVQTPAGAPSKERAGLSVEQARALLEAARGERLGGLITLSLLLGLRPGEVAGLTWPMVDFDSTPPTVRIEHSLRRTSKGMVLVSPKTASSRRTIALPQVCVDALREQKSRQASDAKAAGKQWANSDRLVFTSETGTPLDPSNTRRSFDRIAAKAGLVHVHPHQLRHAAASLLSAAGVPLEDIADMLGHRSPTITADIYRHPVNPVRDGHMAVMAALVDESTASSPSKTTTRTTRRRRDRRN
jgi:integrase